MHQAIASACTTEQQSGLQKKGDALAPPLQDIMGMPLGNFLDPCWQTPPHWLMSFHVAQRFGHFSYDNKSNPIEESNITKVSGTQTIVSREPHFTEFGIGRPLLWNLSFDHPAYVLSHSCRGQLNLTCPLQWNLPSCISPAANNHMLQQNAGASRTTLILDDRYGRHSKFGMILTM